MLSRYSDNSVAAVGLDNQLISLVFLVYQFFSMGAAILCAQYIGAGLRKSLIQVVGIALVVNLALGLVVSALLFFFAGELLQLMGLRPALMGDGVIYLRLTGAWSFFQALSLTFSASLRSADKVVYPMMVTAIVNVINFFGNYALIFGHWGCPQLGVEGAAIATVVSRVIGGDILVGHLVGQQRRQAAYILGNYFFRISMMVTLTGSVAVGVSYFIGIPLGYGLVGMWIGFALDENIRGVILLRRWRSGKWKDKGFVKNLKVF